MLFTLSFFVLCPGRESVSAHINIFIRFALKILCGFYPDSLVVPSIHDIVPSFDSRHKTINCLVPYKLINKLYIKKYIIYSLCPGRESNPHPVKDDILSVACIPIPPPGQYLFKTHIQRFLKA